MEPGAQAQVAGVRITRRSRAGQALYPWLDSPGGGRVRR